MTSISEDTSQKIMAWSTQFNIVLVYGVVRLLQVNIQERHLDINITKWIINTKLYNMDIHIHTMGNEITRLNI